MLFRKTFTTEQEIIKACLKNDRKAQEQLYHAYSGKFLAICLRYLKDRDLAEDVMIEGFMKIFDKLEQYQGMGSFEGWMKRIIITQSLLTLRSSKNLNMEVHLDDLVINTQSSYELSHLETEDILILIQELPVGYRTVFNLYAIEGYSHKEIGDLLGVTESTSKSQLNRARNLLKQKIADQETKERSING